MNSFIQEYGRTIVAVIIVLAFIVFASVYGDTVTQGVKDSLSTFESATEQEFQFTWENDGTLIGKEVIFEYDTGDDMSKYYYDYDLDGNWYKISNTVYTDAPIYCKWKVADETGNFLTDLAGKTLNELTVGESLASGKQIKWKMPSLGMGLIHTVIEDHSYSGGGRAINLEPGLYIWSPDIIFAITEHLEVYTCDLNADVPKSEFNGTSYVKISSRTFTKEDVIGKELTAKVSGETVNATITEDMVSTEGGNTNIMNVIYCIPNGSQKGIYIPDELLVAGEFLSIK